MKRRLLIVDQFNDTLAEWKETDGGWEDQDAQDGPIRLSELFEEIEAVLS